MKWTRDDCGGLNASAESGRFRARIAAKTRMGFRLQFQTEAAIWRDAGAFDTQREAKDYAASLMEQFA